MTPSRRALALVACVAWGCEWSPNLPHDPTSSVPPPVRIPQPIAAAGENESADILQHYADRPPIHELEPRGWELPFQSKRLAVALLIVAAKDRVEDLDLVLTPDARWGLPDRRQFGARPVFGDDDGEAFLADLRTALHRVPSTAAWKSSPMPPGVQETIRTGAEPMWISFGEGTETVLIREVMYRGTARIDFVGFFVEPPVGRIKVVGQPGIPPTMPPPRKSAEALLDEGSPEGEEPDPDGPPVPRPVPVRGG
jgi:hypothetical protein